jgi:phage-related protein (TIGR01555 family)
MWCLPMSSLRTLRNGGGAIKKRLSIWKISLSEWLGMISLRKYFARFVASFAEPEQPASVPSPEARKEMRISAATMEKAQYEGEKPPRIERYEPPVGVIPADQQSDVLAMDSTPYDFVNQVYGSAHFRGYPHLAMLMQQPEYRKISETIAKEMTRKWIKLVSTGDADKSDKIAKLEKALKKYKVRALFRKAAELDGFFGRGQIYIDVKTPSGGVASEDPDELKTVLIRDKAKIAKGSLRGFKAIEPVWTYPSAYNSTNPLAPDYYKPSAWFVMGKTVHASRLIMFVSREVPDMLKAAYNFGGISMSQLAEPYVSHWLRTRNSVSDMLHSFSICGIKTNMEGVLAGGAGEEMFKRAQLFGRTRDNSNLFMLDKDSEEFFQYNTPLSGLDALQAQSQEQMASVSNIPLVKLLGITPAGLNANSDGEIRVFYDFIHSLQEDLFGDPLTKVLEVVQLSEFGEIDDDIGYEFVPLYQLTDIEKATKRKTDADTDAVLINAGVISPDESRARLAADPDNAYHSLDLNDPAPGDDDDDDREE